MEGLGSQTDLLSSLLNAASLRHRVIAQNVANVNTPGYRRQEVAFEDDLARALAAHGDNAAGSVQPRVVEAADEAERADGNTVDIDAEMGRLNKNAVLYQVYAQLLAHEIGTMRSAISGK